MELNEAIEHATQTSKNLKAEAKAWQGCAIQSTGKTKAKECLECAAEHEQLASWLTELAERREADRWISVDEALPEKEGWYLVDRKERTFSIQYFFFGTADHKPYWSGECKVYYWRPLPKAPESEDSK